MYIFNAFALAVDRAILKKNQKIMPFLASQVNGYALVKYVAFRQKECVQVVRLVEKYRKA
jgi:hypothetical protein